MTRQIFTAVILLAGLANQAQATLFTFTEIAHSSDGFAGGFFEQPFNTPSLNNLGEVVFRGRRLDGTIGIYVGSGGALNVIADSLGPFPRIGFGVPGINDHGDVVFLSNISRGNTRTRRIVRGSTTTATNDLIEVIKPGDTLPGFASSALSAGDPAPAINNSGTVSIAQQARTGGIGAYAINAATIEIAPSTTANAFGGTAINSSGQVALTGDLGRKVWIGDGTTLTQIADIATVGAIFDSPDINDAGSAVVFAGNGLGGSAAEGFYRYRGGTLRHFLRSTDEYNFSFSIFENQFPGINNTGQVAGIANVRLSSGQFSRTLFVDDPLSGRVIGQGDLLFGRRVSYVTFYKGINDESQLAFHANFLDGSEGIYRADAVSLGSATVPEPASVAIWLLGVACLLIAGTSQRRRKLSGSHRIA